MTTIQSPVSDMAVTVKCRELQRGLLAEMRGDRTTANRHLLAAAHLELVLAEDYADSGDDDMSLRSRLSAASCFWRSGQRERARSALNDMLVDYPTHAAEIEEVIAELREASTPNVR